MYVTKYAHLKSLLPRVRVSDYLRLPTKTPTTNGEMHLSTYTRLVVFLSTMFLWNPSFEADIIEILVKGYVV
jgi:hypothetical protein